MLDGQQLPDNRNYDFSQGNFYERGEFNKINEWVYDNAKIIDLGCGNGSLIKYLQDKKGAEGKGVEISQSGVDFCKKNGLNVKYGEIDKKETYFEYVEEKFDYAICNVSLQMVMYPEVLLNEMARISKFQIISFPNFAYFENRLDLLFNGVMPRPMLHKYKWYNTGHIHQLSNRDFKTYCKMNKIKIISVYHMGCFRIIANIIWPNFFSKETIFLCQKYDL